MKVILYIVALVTLVAAGIFVKGNINLHQEQLDLTKQKETDNLRISKKIKNIEGDLRDAGELKETRIDEKNGRDSDLEVQVQNKKGLVNESASFNNKLTALRAEQAEVDEFRKRLEVIVKEANIPIDKIGEYIEQLEDERKQLNKSHGDLLAEVERFTGDVALNKGKIGDFKTAQTKRRKNLKSNGVSSLITSVDNDWGFVVVKPHADASINVDSKLIVVRGHKHVGRLSINAIEDGRVLANIDYSSIVAGMRICAGDRVILSKARTN